MIPYPKPASEKGFAVGMMARVWPSMGTFLLKIPSKGREVRPPEVCENSRVRIPLSHGKSAFLFDGFESVPMLEPGPLGLLEFGEQNKRGSTPDHFLVLSSQFISEFALKEIGFQWGRLLDRFVQG